MVWFFHGLVYRLCLRAGGELAGWTVDVEAVPAPGLLALACTTTGHGCFVRLPTSQLSRQ
jgi:hypothetical protein